MLTDLLHWWRARMIELLPDAWPGRSRHAPDAVVIDAADRFEDVTARLRRNGQEAPIALDAIVRSAGRMQIVVRPQPRFILEKLHTVPATARRDLAQVLRHELGRITPFSADAVHWHWESRPAQRDRALLDVHLTIVPRTAVGTTLRGLAAMGIRPRFIEAGAARQLRLLQELTL
jgi:general secretion pathway protein L